MPPSTAPASTAAAELPSEPQGVLNVKLMVKDDAGINRVSDPVTSGIPIPQSMNLRNTQGLRIVGPDGKAALPAQFSVLARWNGTAGDNSKPIQWVLVDFQADVKANRTSTYYLKYEPSTTNSAPSRPIKLSEDPEAITVNTGSMQFRISKKKFNLFDGVWLDRNGDGRFSDEEAIVSPGQADGGVLTDTFGVEYATRLGTRKVTVEENGPLRTVIKVEGRHKSDSDQALAIGIYDYQVRIHAFAGKSFLKVHYTLKNSPPCPSPLGGFGECKDPVFGPIAFKDLALITTLNLEARKYKLFGEKKLEGSADDIVLYQDSSGANTWNGYHDKYWGYDIQVAHDKNPAPEVEGGPSFRGFKVYHVKDNDWKEIGSGNRAQGWVDVYDSKWGLTAQVRHFWQQCPKGIDILGNKLYLRLWPHEYKGIHWLDDGIHKTHEVLYAFHLANANSEEMVKGFNDPLLASAPTKWYNDARVIGPYGDLMEAGAAPGEFKLNRADIGSKKLVYASRDQFNFWGWIPFGDFKANPSGAGCPCTDPSTFGPYLQTFNRELFDVAEEFARQWLDTRSYHRDLVAVEEVKGAQPDLTPYWQGTHYQGWMPPDPYHLWFSNLYEYYLLTGNRKALEAAHELMRFGRHAGFWWHFTVDKQTFPIERAYGWLAYELTRMYEITGELSYLDDAEKLLKKAYDQTDKRRGNLLDATLYTPGSARGGTYEGSRLQYDYGAKSWMVGVAMLGVGKYADVVLSNNIPRSQFDGEDARDFLVGLADLLAREIFRPDIPIFPEDWFLTNPQPPDKELFPYGKHNSIEIHILAGLSIAYRLTGNPLYREVVNTSLGKWGWNAFDPYNQTAFANRQRQDTAPPSLVTDLQAQKGSAAGEVLLKWSAPGGDGNKGKAFRYQIKYSEKPIVERIDCSQTDHCYSPCEINGQKTICPKETGESTFWAAINVKGEPAPQPAGTVQQCTVKGLNPKKAYYFVMKAEDEAHNLSGLSNVVKISP